MKDSRNLTTTGKIKYFYQNSQGTWAVYSPAEELKDDWLWSKAFCSIESLIRA